MYVNNKHEILYQRNITYDTVNYRRLKEKIIVVSKTFNLWDLSAIISAIENNLIFFFYDFTFIKN